MDNTLYNNMAEVLAENQRLEAMARDRYDPLAGWGAGATEVDVGGNLVLRSSIGTTA